MDINAYTEIESLIFQENFAEAMRKLDTLETQVAIQHEKLLIALRKVHIFRQTGDFSGLCKFLRDLLISNKKETEGWPREIQTKLFENLLDSSLVSNDNSIFSEVIAILLISDNEANKTLGRTYQALKPEIVSSPQAQVTNQIQHDIDIEFKEIPTEVELLLNFANPHFSMEGFTSVYDATANKIQVSKPNGQSVVDLSLKEQVSAFSWSFDAKTKGVLIKLQKGEPNKIWRGLNPRPGQCLPTYLIIRNTSDYMQQSQKPTQKKEKNWDKIVEEEEVNDLKEKNYDCDPALHFFKQIYENADEDARRAMLKSFSESGGKALSTNWNEVKQKDYAKKVPDK